MKASEAIDQDPAPAPAVRFRMHGVEVQPKSGAAFTHWFWRSEQADEYVLQAAEIHGSAERVRRTGAQAERQIDERIREWLAVQTPIPKTPASSPQPPIPHVKI